MHTDTSKKCHCQTKENCGQRHKCNPLGGRLPFQHQFLMVVFCTLLCLLMRLGSAPTPLGLYVHMLQDQNSETLFTELMYTSFP